MSRAKFKNDHLSASRVERYATCPLGFYLDYIERARPEPNESLRFGKAIHAVLEQLIREHMEQERTSVLSEDRATELWQKAFAEENLSGVELFQEGLCIIKGFIKDQGIVDHQDILAVEREFRFPVGSFTVLGFIDRVDRIDDETLEVVDYKSSRLLFSRDELHNNLQLSLYHIAAQKLWPWAKKIKLTFNMLRHGIQQETERTPEQLEAALRYVEMVGHMTEESNEYPARLNQNCPWCTQKQNCSAYSDALKGKREFICEDLGDLEAVAKEREEVSTLAKVLYGRKKVLEEILKKHLKDNDELVLGGVSYRMFKSTKVDHPLDKTVKLLADATGMNWEELIGRIASVDNKALDSLLKEIGKNVGRSKVSLLKAELDASANKQFIPRFWAKKLRA